MRLEGCHFIVEHRDDEITHDGLHCNLGLTLQDAFQRARLRGRGIVRSLSRHVVMSQREAAAKGQYTSVQLASWRARLQTRPARRNASNSRHFTDQSRDVARLTPAAPLPFPSRVWNAS